MAFESIEGGFRVREGHDAVDERRQGGPDEGEQGRCTPIVIDAMAHPDDRDSGQRNRSGVDGLRLRGDPDEYALSARSEYADSRSQRAVATRGFHDDVVGSCQGLGTGEAVCGGAGTEVVDGSWFEHVDGDGVLRQHGDSEAADGPCSDDEDAIARGDRRRVDGFEHGDQGFDENVFRFGRSAAQGYQGATRHDEEFGCGAAVLVEADLTEVGTLIASTRSAGRARLAEDHRAAGDGIAGGEVMDVSARFLDDAHPLVSEVMRIRRLAVHQIRRRAVQ